MAGPPLRPSQSKSAPPPVIRPDWAGCHSASDRVSVSRRSACGRHAKAGRVSARAPTSYPEELVIRQSEQAGTQQTVVGSTVALNSVIPMTAGRPAAARPRGTSSTRSIPGGPARHHRVRHQELLERDVVAVGVQHQPLVRRRRLKGAVDGHGVVDDQACRPQPPHRSAVQVTSRRGTTNGANNPARGLLATHHGTHHRPGTP